MHLTAIQPTLEEKVAFLSSPEAYGERLGHVEVIETHMSWLFLTPRHVYKIKKPVHNEYFDFRSLNARRHNCVEEVRLNRRLAPEVYLGVVALTVESESGLRIGGQGEPVEYLVQMQRLPAERMLDSLMKQDGLTEGEMDEVARVLISFYAQSPLQSLTSHQYCQRYQGYVDAQARELINPTFRLSREQVEEVAQRQSLYIQQASELGLHSRAGHLIEAHGDLRPEHICLTQPPVMIDCLEFSQELRTLDPVDELAYLSLECEMAGKAWVGNRILQAYMRAVPDLIPEQLVCFYKSYRALLRAKLSARHLLDPSVSRRRHWSDKAKRYLAVAQQYAHRL